MSESRQQVSIEDVQKFLKKHNIKLTNEEKRFLAKTMKTSLLTAEQKTKKIEGFLTEKIPVVEKVAETTAKLAKNVSPQDKLLTRREALMKEKTRGLVIGLLVGLLLGIAIGIGTSFAFFDRYAVVVVNQFVSIKYDKLTGKSWEYNLKNHYWTRIPNR